VLVGDPTAQRDGPQEPEDGSVGFAGPEEGLDGEVAGGMEEKKDSHGYLLHPQTGWEGVLLHEIGPEREKVRALRADEREGWPAGGVAEDGAGVAAAAGARGGLPPFGALG